MPIMSYLVYPMKGESAELRSILEAIPGCQVTPASNAELLILVTDTDSSAEEKELTLRLRDIPSLSLLALVSGYSDPDDNITPETEDGADPAPYRPSDQTERRK